MRIKLRRKKMAMEIVTISGSGDNIDAIKEVLEDSLAFSKSRKHWLNGRIPWTVTIAYGTRRIGHRISRRCMSRGIGSAGPDLQLFSVSNPSSLLQLSRGLSELVNLPFDETLWEYVNHGDLRWILPVQGIKGEVDRTNEAIKGPTALPSVLHSREFPFARFISDCVRSGSRKNRRRLWKIFKQFIVLWGATGSIFE
jgi:hypothetical protein